MKNDGYEYSLVEKSDSSVELKISFSPDYYYFQGHFEEFKLLPALLQIYLVVEFFHYYFQVDLMPKGIPNMKFVKPICPDQEMHLQICQDQEKRTVTFSFKRNEKIYSSGVIQL